MVSRSAASRRRNAGRGLRRSARETALQILLEWEGGVENVDAILARRLDGAGLHGRDRALAAELTLGALRWRGRLDWQLAHLVDRPLDELETPVLGLLRLGLYQIEHLDRIPPHAAVDTAVELAKRHAGRGAAALVNAVLRRAPQALLDLVEPDAEADPVGHLEARTSHPRWILERWLARYGFRRTLKLAAANNQKPPLTLRVTSDRVDAVGLVEDLRAREIEAELGVFLPSFVRLPGGWHPAVRGILESGLAVVQDEAAGLVAHVARPFEGADALDLCAAPGGKAIHFAELCGGAQVVAADVSRPRLAALRETAQRLGLAVFPVVSDGRAPAFRARFSRVLVDAPCTNTGVLGKRPDARWRRCAEDVARLAELQGELLDAGRERVRPGGLLVYSTCSLEPEENEGVIEAYLERHPSDAIVPAAEVLPEELVQGEFLSTNPAELPLDGAFAAALRPGGASLSVLS